MERTGYISLKQHLIKVLQLKPPNPVFLYFLRIQVVVLSLESGDLNLWSGSAANFLISESIQIDCTTSYSGILQMTFRYVFISFFLSVHLRLLSMPHLKKSFCLCLNFSCLAGCSILKCPIFCSLSGIECCTLQQTDKQVSSRLLLSVYLLF